MRKWSENFREVSKKIPLPESFLYLREPEILLKEGLYHRCFLSWEIFENE